jgi:hypothetical protein
MGGAVGTERSAYSEGSSQVILNAGFSASVIEGTQTISSDTIKQIFVVSVKKF